MLAATPFPARWTFVMGLTLSVARIVDSAYRDVQAIDLSGDWTLRNRNQSIRVPARVPGHAPQILYEAGVLPEPLSRCRVAASTLAQT